MSKKKYKMIVKEILGRELEIEADSFVDAADKAFSAYEGEKVVLTADDCISRDVFLEDMEEGRTFHIYSK